MRKTTVIDDGVWLSFECPHCGKHDYMRFSTTDPETEEEWLCEKCNHMFIVITGVEEDNE